MRAKRSLKRAPQAHAPAEMQASWPSLRLKQWPLPLPWVAPTPEAITRPLVYQKTLGTLQNLFNNDASLATTRENLSDFCFQQGGFENNGNARDRAFFNDCVAHDLLFFRGDQGRPLLSGLPVDPKLYSALPQMEASFLDIYQVTSRGWLGGVRLQSALRQGLVVEGGVRPFKGPSLGDWVLGRLVQIGKGRFLDAPLLRLTEAQAWAAKARFEVELAAHQAKFPEISAEALLKVAGYHLYEFGAALLLQEELGQSLPSEVTLRPRMIEWSIRSHQRAAAEANFGAFSGAKVLESSKDGSSLMLSIPLTRHSMVHPTLRDAILSLDLQTLSLIAFVDPGQDALRDAIQAKLPASLTPAITDLDPNATYRSLRHVIRPSALA